MQLLSSYFRYLPKSSSCGDSRGLSFFYCCFLNNIARAPQASDRCMVMSHAMLTVFTDAKSIIITATPLVHASASTVISLAAIISYSHLWAFLQQQLYSTVSPGNPSPSSPGSSLLLSSGTRHLTANCWLFPLHLPFPFSAGGQMVPGCLSYWPRHGWLASCGGWPAKWSFCLTSTTHKVPPTWRGIPSPDYWQLAHQHYSLQF
jgi:hypothetical protein